MASIYERNFKKLIKIIPDLLQKEPGWACRMKAEGFMDLHVDFLKVEPQGDGKKIVISLAHRYLQNGDSMADPDMEIAVYPNAGMAEALTYQQDGLGIYQVVYPEPGKFYPKRKKELNSFLETWLRNIVSQGHKIEEKEAA